MAGENALCHEPIDALYLLFLTFIFKTEKEFNLVHQLIIQQCKLILFFLNRTQVLRWLRMPGEEDDTAPLKQVNSLFAGLQYNRLQHHALLRSVSVSVSVCVYVYLVCD